MRDCDIIKVLNNVKNLEDLSETDDMCSFDAENDTAIVEFKVRRKEYDQWMIELYKLSHNYRYSQVNSKLFYYVVVTPSKMIIWNISALILYKSLSVKTISSPRQTDFDKTGNIFKLVSFLKVEDAEQTFNILIN